ncbi:hypothetical protein U1Q18_005694 [Sarracenia purpurea var. burkii]
MGWKPQPSFLKVKWPLEVGGPLGHGGSLGFERVEPLLESGLVGSKGSESVLTGLAFCASIALADVRADGEGGLMEDASLCKGVRDRRDGGLLGVGALSSFLESFNGLGAKRPARV